MQYYCKFDATKTRLHSNDFLQRCREKLQLMDDCSDAVKGSAVGHKNWDSAHRTVRRLLDMKCCIEISESEANCLPAVTPVKCPTNTLEVRCLLNMNDFGTVDLVD
jgi:hypothetical protein